MLRRCRQSPCRCLGMRDRPRRPSGLNHRMRGRFPRQSRTFLQALRRPDSQRRKARKPWLRTVWAANCQMYPARHPGLPHLPPTGCRGCHWLKGPKLESCRRCWMVDVFQSCVSPVAAAIFSKAIRTGINSCLNNHKIDALAGQCSQQASRFGVRQFVQPWHRVGQAGEMRAKARQAGTL